MSPVALSLALAALGLSAALDPGRADPLPAGATMRLGTARFRQAEPIVSLAVSPDGKTAYTCNFPGTPVGATRAFDLASGRPRFVVRGDETGAVALSPDGRSLVTKEGLRLHVRDPGTGRELRTIPVPGDPKHLLSALAFRPDGKSVAVIADPQAVHLIDFASGKVVRSFSHEAPPEVLFPEHRRTTVVAIAFSPDGKTLAAGGLDRVVSLKTVEGHKLPVTEFFVRLWDVDTGKELRRFMHGPVESIACLAFSPDGQTLATGATDSRLRLFDVATGRERKEFPRGGDRPVRAVAFSPDGKTVAAGSGAVRLYETVAGELRLEIGRQVNRLLFTDAGKTLTGTTDGAIHRWDAATGRPLTPERASDSIVGRIRVSPDGSRIVTRTWGNDTRIWDGATGRHLRAVAGTNRDMALSPDGRYLAWVDAHRVTDAESGDTYTGGHRIVLYDMATGREVERFPTFPEHTRDVVSFTADGKTLVTFDRHEGMAQLWDVETGAVRRRFRGLQSSENYSLGSAGQVAVSADGSTLAVTCSGLRLGVYAPKHPLDEVHLWDVASGTHLRQLFGHTKDVKGVALSPDGRVLVAAGTVWDAATGRRLATLPEEQPVMAFSPDGRSLATAEDSVSGPVRVWEVATWTERTRVAGHRDGTTALAFTSDGRLLTGGLDTTVLAWDVALRPGGGVVALDDAWAGLTDPDAGRAYKAQGRLLAEPARAVEFLAEKIKPVAEDPDGLRRLIADLDADRFAVREAATKALADLGVRARPALEETARTSTSPEAAARARKALGELRLMTPEQVPHVRAVEVVERIASAEAKALLKQWAAGARGAVLTEESHAALARLDRAAARGR